MRMWIRAALLLNQRFFNADSFEISTSCIDATRKLEPRVETSSATTRDHPDRVCRRDLLGADDAKMAAAFTAAT
ncbi:MAG TPA: hypothetical protein VGC41_07215, partial [Kofleriaceae bacterium]